MHARRRCAAGVRIVARRVIAARDITALLRETGVAADDVLYLHSGLATALRAEGRTPEEKVDTVLSGVRDAVPDGVLAMPTYTYSFTKGEPFDLERTPSTVGALTERFRHTAGVRRTPDPIFSSAVLGTLSPEWEGPLFEVGDKDCFGDASIFEYFRQVDGWLGFLGIGFEYATYVHRIEQRLDVPYRYRKPFSGEVTSPQNPPRTVTAVYNVRRLDEDVVTDFGPLEARLREAGHLREHRIERGPRLALVRARAVAEVAEREVARNPDFLLRRGHA